MSTKVRFKAFYHFYAIYITMLYRVNATSSSSGTQSSSLSADDFFLVFFDDFFEAFLPGTGSGFMQSGTATWNPTTQSTTVFTNIQ